MALLSLLVALSAQVTGSAFDPGPNPLLLQHPTMNDHQIVFAYADALWTVPRGGGAAQRLTVGPGVVSNPFFSPDGKSIAFSANYDGNTDVYVMPAQGGTPKRLTSHPDPDFAVGWTPDGKSVLFASSMLSNTDYPRLFTVSIEGGFPQPLPLPSGAMGVYSPDGKSIAYVPHDKWETAWKRYRGGQTYPIWIADLATSRVKPIPRDNTNDYQPMWIGSKVFYLTDKRGPVGLSSFDTATGIEKEEIVGDGFDIKSATAGPGGIVYEKLGSIHIFDPILKQDRKVPISISGDFLAVRPEFKNLEPYISGVSISPSGNRIAVTARGWALTVPAKKGDTHLLDDTQGLERRTPAWSPDGQTLAYVTDVSGHEQLALKSLANGKERCVDLGGTLGIFDGLNWSPDGSMLTYTDYQKNIWVINVKSGVNTLVVGPNFNNPGHAFDATWSPDSKWLTYTHDLDNHLNAVYVYEIATKKITQITDGMADAGSPIFDRNGLYLYFYASTNIGAASSWLDISSLTALNEVSSVYAVVLRKDTPHPLQPESDEEPIKAETPAEAPKPVAAAADAKPATPPPAKALIELDGIESRIIALPVPSGVYAGLVAGPSGSFFTLTTRPRAIPLDVATMASAATLGKFTVSDRSFTPFGSGITNFMVTPDGSKALVSSLGGISIIPTAMPTPPGTGHVSLSDLQVKIDPKVEWASMYHSIWRNERLRFYAPNLNGLNTYEIEKRYEPFLNNIASRTDLNYLFDDMLGELCVGHEFPGGGELPRSPRVAGGLLGADFSFANGRYKLDRVYTGERWNPELFAPLAQPGVNAKAGEYVLSIDGHDLTSATDIYLALEGKAGKQVKIKLGSKPDGTDAREVTVKPIGNEFGLRQSAWEEDNRAYVLSATHGRAGYVHVPDTEFGGWTAFTRYYYAQVGKDGMVVDERFNHGGLINDYMIREMQKPLDAAFQPRFGKPWPTPGAAIFGPKVMLINEMSGSGGDMFPWLFRHEKVGKIVGKRTWGGLIAAFGFSTLDGGHINAPDDAFWNVDANNWDVENKGVPPDIDIELDPFVWRQGHDSQLDAAILEINKRLDDYRPRKLEHPPYPDRTLVNVKY